MKFLILFFLPKAYALLSLEQPEYVLFIPVNGTAKILCVSDGHMDNGNPVIWIWRAKREVKAIKSCGYNQDSKYSCRVHDNHSITFEINSMQEGDSGMYYCAYNYVSRLIIAGGTLLIVGDGFTSQSSVHLLSPLWNHYPNTNVEVACVVSAVRHEIHMIWNICGTRHKGRITHMKEPGGTWTFLNHISIPKDTWDHKECLSCDVQFSSSHFTTIKVEKAVHRGFASTCSHFLIAMPVVGFLLLVAVSVYLTWTYKRPGKDPQQSKGWNAEFVTQEGIVYAQLDLHSREHKRVIDPEY